MDRYRYVKAPVGQPLVSEKKPKKQLFPTILITLGSIIIANVAWPLISYQLFTSPAIVKNELIWPVSTQVISQIKNTGYPGIEPIAHSDTTTPQVLGSELDYTDARTWFPDAPFQDSQNEIQEYSISIPKINIEDAKVIVGGEDLNQSLIHYPGTAVPGQLGSPVIFGHSILRQFYNPSINNKDRYISIFSMIMTLSSGDRIYVDYDGIRYTYEVKEKVEVQPDDLFILEQRFNNRELKLITCTPEGTYLRRGVVIAQLVDLNDTTKNRR